MPHVEISPRAQRDLDGHADYIAMDDEAASDRFLRMVRRKAELYAAHPAMGRVRPELGSNIRSFPTGAYVVFYSPIHDGIIIRRVLHGAQDIETEFPA